jgi:hypothetical protein
VTTSRAGLTLAAVFVFQALARAIDPDVTPADVQRAVSIAISSDSSRARFHESYRIPVNDSTVELIETITEFRRFVMASEEQLLLGNWMLARGGFDSKGRTLRDLLLPWRGQVSIRTRLRFHPLHSYTAMPAIDIMVGEPSYQPLDVIRTPIITSADQPGGSTFMTGAVVETFFNAPSIHDRALQLRVVFDGKELVRALVDFSKVE